MINTELFGGYLKNFGFNLFTGVPCSFLKPLINFAINECEYIPAVNEGEAVAISAGARIGGRKSVVLMQNSGLTNASSPLTSLIQPFRIPILGFVSLRGEPGLMDEPQHEIMGEITGELLTLMKVKWEYLANEMEEALKQLQRATIILENNQPFFFIVKKNTFANVNLQKQMKIATKNQCKMGKKAEDQFPTRMEALNRINALKGENTIQLATTGKTGRELYEIEDVPNNFYMVGSMGCISSLGLGLSITKKEKEIIAIDGDGALLMRMGSLATNGYQNPKNLLHILLDNGSHDSTGGQATVSHNVDFVGIAACSGYANAIYVHNLDELTQYIQAWKQEQKLTFLYIKIAKGSMNGVGRPKEKPFEVKERLQVFLND